MNVPAQSSDRPGFLRRARDRLALRFGVTPEIRRAVVGAMLDRHGQERASYWLLLVLSMGIATYGLVLGSTGVVIGAMLVSPLMSPLVEIGMGLVTGSAVLVLHGALRTASSIVVVVAASALLTRLLPYHELTGEILARTSPTLIDLYVASFCALAAAYTTARQSSDTVAAAAGTAISISLVPPLCAVGWGIGSHDPRVSSGAALLFTANFCAILLFTVVVFVVLGFDAIPAGDLIRDASASDRIAAKLHRFFGTRYGPALRLLMPVVLVAAVFVPLRRALDEVAWKARVRADVERVLSDLPAAKHAVQSSVVVEDRAVSLRLVIVGAPRDAAALEDALKRRIALQTGVTPIVSVTAVPDEASVRTIAERALAPQPIAPRRPKFDPAEDRRVIDDALRAAWPSRAGELKAWRVVIDGDGAQTVVVVHFGDPLGAAGEQLLLAAMRDELDGKLGIRDIALSSDVLEAQPDRTQEWFRKLVRAVELVGEARVGMACVTVPSASPKAPASDALAAMSDRVVAELARLPPERVAVTQGDRWSFQIVADACASTTTSASDAGATGASDGGRGADAAAR